MKHARLAFGLALAALLLLGITPAQASTMANEESNDTMILADLMSTDVMDYDCIPEAKLDSAFLAGGKGLRMPPTCMTEVSAPDCEFRELFTGYTLSADECASFKYRWFRQYTPEMVLFITPECDISCRTPEVVPLPASGLLLLAGAGALLLMRRRPV